MPRKPRFNLVGVPQYVIQRGNNREPCFFAEQPGRLGVILHPSLQSSYL